MSAGPSIENRGVKDKSVSTRFGSHRTVVVAWALLAVLTLMVQARFLVSVDHAGLQWVVTHRPAGVTELMNWLFRMGFAQVDGAIALVWAAWLLWKERGHLARPDLVVRPASLPPLCPPLKQRAEKTKLAEAGWDRRSRPVSTCLAQFTGLRLFSPRLEPRARLVKLHETWRMHHLAGPAAYQGGGGQAPALHQPISRMSRLLRATAPLVLLLAIFLQAGLRLVVTQPAPGSSYELQRDFAAEPLGLALDRSDAAARQLFVAATAPHPTGVASPAKSGGGTASLTQGSVRGSYPSGHACRVLFLSLLAAGMIRGGGKARRAASLVVALLPTALVGYSALYFGYHWPSDLLGGILLALGVYPVAARLFTIF